MTRVCLCSIRTRQVFGADEKVSSVVVGSAALLLQNRNNKTAISNRDFDETSRVDVNEDFCQ